MANETMRMSAAGFAALRAREHMALRYYQDQAGHCTWGVGTLAHHGPCSPEELRRPVALVEVNAALVTRVREAENTVRRTVQTHPLSQAQFDALVSFTYNTGGRGAEPVLETANQGRIAQVARQMNHYIYIHPRHNGRRMPAVRSRGLVNRRREEAAPFQQPNAGVRQ